MVMRATKTIAIFATRIKPNVLSETQLLYGARHKHKNGKFEQGMEHSLFRSAELEKLWDRGFSTIGEVTYESAGYVARYVMKKITGNPSKTHYQGKTPEFALMSRRPGIGKPWLLKFKSDVYPKDYFTLKGKKMRPPKHYDYILEGIDPRMLKGVKDRRAAQEALNVESGQRFPGC